MKEWMAWMKKYYPAGNITDASNTYGYGVAYLMVAVLKACGDNLTRENVMNEAAKIHIQGGRCRFPGSPSRPAPPTMRRSSRCR